MECDIIENVLYICISNIFRIIYKKCKKLKKKLSSNKTKMKLLKIEKSNNKGKKWKATFTDGEKTKTINFGASGYRDYTLMSNKDSEFYIADKKERDKVRSNYQARHKKDLETEKGKSGISAGALSFYVLWTVPTVRGGIRNFKKRYKL